MSTNNSCILGAILMMVGALAVGFMPTGPAHAVTFTLDPGAIGLTGTAFTADALKATEWSHIAFTSATEWTELGYAQITGAVSNGTVFTPGGLNSTYTLYFEFGGTGNTATNTFTTAYMTLYGVNGVSTFSIDASFNAVVDNHSNIPVELSNSTLIQGTTGQTFISPGPPPQIDFFATLLTTFTPTAAGSSFFVLPFPSLNLFGDFYHTADGVFFPTATDVVLIGGDDTLTFVPEPISLLLLVAGLPGLLLFRRRA